MSQIAIIGLILTFVLILGGFLFKNNKIYFVIQVAWMLILLDFNTDSMDFFGNQSLFESANSSNIFSEGFFMGGYYYLSSLAHTFNITYLEFNAILATISTAIICYVVLKLSNNPCIVLSLFMAYPLMSSVIQKRYYIAMGVLILAVYYLYYFDSKWKKTIVFISVVSLACQFHTASVFLYTLAVFLWIPDRLKKYFAIGGLIVLTALKGQLAAVLQSSQNASLSGKSEFYFTTIASDNIWHYLFWIVWQLSFVILMFYLLNKPNIREILGEKYCYFIWILNWWSLWIIPLYSFDPVFARLFRIVIIFNYVAISNLVIVKQNLIGKVNLSAAVLQIGLSISSFIIFNALAGAPFQDLVFPIFESNAFFSMLGL